MADTMGSEVLHSCPLSRAKPAIPAGPEMARRRYAGECRPPHPAGD